MLNQIDVTECSICCHELLTELVTLECGHVFHSKCIQNFENHPDTQKQCANCRQFYRYKTTLKFQIEKPSENIEEKATLAQMKMLYNDKKEQLHKLKLQMNQDVKSQKEVTKRDYFLHSKYMMMYMTKMSLKEENQRLERLLQVYDSTHKEYTNQFFRYGEELNSIKDKLAVSGTIERIKNNLLDVREIEHFINFSDFDNFSVEEQNKLYFEVIQSLLGKLTDNDNNSSKKLINSSQKNVKTITINDTESKSKQMGPVICLSGESDRIDLIQEEESLLSSLNSMSKSNSFVNLVDISNSSSSFKNRNSSKFSNQNITKQDTYLKDFSDFNQKLTKSKIKEKIQFNKKDITFVGRKTERSKDKLPQKSFYNLLS